MQHPGLDITLIGSGNIASWLGLKLRRANHKILQVYSREIDHARQLAEKVGAIPVDDLTIVDDRSDVYFIAVTDDAIPTVAEKLHLKDKVVLHTSGITGVEVLSSTSSKTGVFYPFQSISKNNPQFPENFPVLVENPSEDVLDLLTKLAGDVGCYAKEVKGEQRKILHLCGVLVNNFTNHLLAVADDILQQEALSFDLLMPLIRETFSKIEKLPPEQVQTGPAVRNDEKTIIQHLLLLSRYLEYRKLYQAITESIQRHHNKEKHEK